MVDYEDESRRITEGSRSQTCEAFKDAQENLRRSMEGSRFLPQQAFERRDHEREALVQWAKASGKLLSYHPLDSYENVSKHGEHEVAFDPDSGSWLKLTHSDMHGVIVDFEIDYMPPFTVSGYELRQATPWEYIDRMILSDRELGSETTLEGVYLEDSVPRILSSQLDVVGRNATDNEIKTEMTRLGFTYIPRFHAGKEGSASFVNFGSSIALFDSHGGNFRTDEEGDIHVIDAVIQELSDSELDYFKHRLQLERD